MAPNNSSDTGAGENKKAPVDKTFIEGSEEQAARSPLQTGIRVDASQAGQSNPYMTRSGMKDTGDTAKLPSGNEPIPLCSGTIVGLLGTGGMARVYKIWNEKLEVFRAVKILLPTQQKDLKNRFETEAKITAKLHHPNIVEIYSVGDWNSLPFLEMEFIDGLSLETLIIRYGKMPPSACSAIAIFIARALVYAHSQEFLLYGKNYHGVIHRDLKPANIMISQKGEVRLMDFGIARPSEASLHTVEGNIVGTMQYLSPEQIDGVDIDARTDLYSFGAILYEMLTGTKTFPQETITNLMKKKIVNEYRHFSDFNFPIAPGLVKITQKCLQASKEKRYPNAQALLKDLETAHKSLTIDDPAQILQNYIRDPSEFTDPAHTKIFRMPFANPKVKKLLIPIISVVIALGVAGTFAFMLFARKPTLEQTQASKEPMAKTETPSPPVAQTIDSVELVPLDTRTPVDDEVKHIEPPAPTTTRTAARNERRTSATRTSTRTSITQASNKNEMSLDRLASKYGTNDPLDIARKALKAGKSDEAIIALEKAGSSDGDADLKTLLLLSAYVDASRTKDALFIANSQNVRDAQYDYLCGRLYQSLNRNDAALDYFEKALTKPSVIRSRNEIRNDALYYTALIRSDMYRKDPSNDNKVQAMNAWNVVKRLYSSNPDHVRARQATSELSIFQ